MSMQSLLMSTAYFGPISLYAALCNHDNAIIDGHEFFVKQSYRNRCEILGANGLQNLSIPLQERKNKSLTKDIKIDYKTSWQQQHWRSIESAYNSSPFFEFLMDDLIALHQRNYEFLLDFNCALQDAVLNIIGKKIQVSSSAAYVAESANCIDVRNSYSPKIKSNFVYPPYVQVFEHKMEFVPNLSILDLLFNVGNESEIYLSKIQNL